MVLIEARIVNVFAEDPEPIDFPGLVTFFSPSSCSSSA